LIVDCSQLLLLFFGVYYLPGRLLSELMPGTRAPEETFPFSVGLGIVVVNVAVMIAIGLPGLFATVFVSYGSVLGVSAALSAVLVLLLYRRGMLVRIRWFARPSYSQVALWVLTALSTVFFLFHYRADGFNDDSCVVRVVTSTLSDIGRPDLLSINTGGEAANEAHEHWTGSLGTNPFLRDNQSQRLGIPVLLSPMVAVFGTFGFRVVYALQGLLMPGIGFLLGFYLLKRRWLAWVVAVFATLNPYSLESRLFDENFMAACFGSLALVLLVRPNPRLFWAGAALSLFLGIRHVGLLVLPAVAWYVVGTREKKGRDLLAVLAGMAVFSLPYLVYHGFLLFERGALFEGGLDRVVLEHSFLGIAFRSGTMWSFPFTEEPLRSPYLAYPNVIEFPLDLLRRFGLVLAAFVPAGLIHLFRSDRRRAWLMVGWFVPVLAAVMLKSDWVEPNKMGVPATVLAPVIVILAAGLAFVVLSGVGWWKKAALLTVGAIMPVVFVPSVRDYQAPMDQRVYDFPQTWVNSVMPDHVEPLLDESSEYVAFDRDRFGLNLLPALPLDAFQPFMLGLHRDQLADDIYNRDLVEYRPPLLTFLTKVFSDLGRTVNSLSLAKVGEGGEFEVDLWGGDKERQQMRTMWLDLDVPPVLAETPLDSQGASWSEPLKLDGDRVYVVKGLRRPWSPLPLNVAFARDRFGSVVILLMSSRQASTYVPPFLDVVEVDAGRFKDNRIPLSLPLDTPIMVSEVRGFVPTRAYLRWVVVKSDDVWLSRPQYMPL